MARQPRAALPVAPQFPQIARLQESLEPYKKQMREDSLVLRNAPQEGRDYNEYIYVGSRELAILDSMRFLRNLSKGETTSDEILSNFQARINEEIAEAHTRLGLQNDYEKMLGKGATEGYAIVQQKLDEINADARRELALPAGV